MGFRLAWGDPGGLERVDLGRGHRRQATVALVSFSAQLEWASLSFGLWSIVVQWLLSFAGFDLAELAHVVTCLIVAVARGREPQ